MKTNLKTTMSLAALLIGLSVETPHAATILYSENFDGEGTAFNAYNAGTSPEVNIGGIAALQSTGTSQGGNAADTAWRFRPGGATTGQFGLRFGSGGAGQVNWATSANSAAILTSRGFSISFDMDFSQRTDTADTWFGVRIGNGGENAAVNAGSVDFGVLSRPNGLMTTFENGAATGLGSAGTTAPRSVELRYEFSSWAAGSAVNFTGLMDGSVIGTDTFTWDGTNDVRIVFGGRNDGTLIDNIVIATVPEPSSAALLGLGGLALILRRRK